jgi:hypothetical protein
MSPVLRIKAEIALTSASKKLASRRAKLQEASAKNHTHTVAVIRKELDKLVKILADDASDKHFSVAARVAICADYLAQIPSSHVQAARTSMVEAHKVLQDVQLFRL